MTDHIALKNLLEFTRDGEWGKGEPTPDHVEMAVIRGTDFAAVRAGDLSSIPRRYIASKAAERKTLQPGDVLIETAGGTKDQPTGRTVYLNERIFAASDVPITCASFSRFLRVKSNIIDPRYLFWYLQSIYTTGEMLPYHIQHTGVARFQYTDFASQWQVPVPDIARQIEIADSLSTIDDKIELNRRMNETLEAIAQAIFRDWFVDFGPTRRRIEGATDPVAILGGLIPDPEKAAPLAAMFPAAFGDDGLPQGWEDRPFVSFLDIIGGGTPKTKISEYWDGDIPWFSVVDTPPKGGVFVRSTEKTITKKGLAESSARLIPIGTTIITARGTVGNIAMAARDMVFNQSCYALRAQAPVGDRFVYLATERMVQRLQAMAHGSVFSTITRATFESLTFPWVGENLFEKFEELLEPVFDKINANGQENETLEETRDLLLPKLMSGEIRLRDAEATN